jgi:hypothetical protein
LLNEFILDSILSNAIKSDGKIKESRLSEYRKVVDALARFVKEFKQGKSSTIYLPFAYPLEHKGIERCLAPVMGENVTAEEVYTKLARLLKEVVALDFKYPTPKHVEAMKKCREFVGQEHGVDIDGCLRTLLTINRETLFHIARIISGSGLIVGSITAIRKIQKERKCEVVKPCEEIALGANTKFDIVKSRIYSIARVYDCLLMILGVAYSPVTKLRKQESVALGSTPFTRTFTNVLLKAITPEDYINALRSFIECVARVYPEPIENAVQYCQELLNRWRFIGVGNRNVESVIGVLYDLINELFQKTP